ncbi:MAG: DNA primase [Herpetosiphon sp.]
MTVTDEIKSRLDIVDMITSNGVALRKAGRNWTGFCPFHPNTRTPAFFVFPETQSYYCFGCHTSGDAFNFVMQRQSIDFPQALEQLATRAGVELAARGSERDVEHTLAATIRLINEDAAIYWNHVLRKAAAGEPGRQYVATRGLQEAAVERWQVGFAPEGWNNLLVYLTDRKGHQPEDIEAAGLSIKREGGGYYDRFRNRVMFPIRDQRGVIVGFGGRSLGDDHAKYLNTPDTMLFHKGTLLYGLWEGRDAIRKAESVVLVEGYLDVISAHQFGFGNVVAPMGTALTKEQVLSIKKFTRTIILALDADAAGRNATLKGLATLREHLETGASLQAMPQGIMRWESQLEGTIKIATLPAGQDPDELIQTSPDIWRQCISAAEPFLDYYLRTYTADLDVQSAKGRAAAIERLAPIIGTLGNAVERAHYIQRLAEQIGLNERVVAGAVESSRRGKSRPVAIAETDVQTSDSYAREDQLLSLLLRFPNIQAGVRTILQGELARFAHLVGTMPGGVREALQRTENRFIWDLFNERTGGGQMDLLEWASSLSPALRTHATTLVQWPDTPPLPEYGPDIRAGQIAEMIALELRKSVVQQRRQQVKAMYESVEDPEEHQRLLELLIELNEYQNIITTPRKSSYFSDLSSRLDPLG